MHTISDPTTVEISFSEDGTEVLVETEHGPVLLILRPKKIIIELPHTAEWQEPLEIIGQPN